MEEALAADRADSAAEVLVVEASVALAAAAALVAVVPVEDGSIDLRYRIYDIRCRVLQGFYFDFYFDISCSGLR